MAIQPLRNLIVIKVDPVKDKTDSGILLDQQWKELPPIGTVVSTGQEVTPAIKVGDRVVFSRYSSIECDPNEPDLRIVNEQGIWAIINE